MRSARPWDTAIGLSLCVCPSICPSLPLSICPSLPLSICPSFPICQFLCPLSVCPSVCCYIVYSYDVVAMVVYVCEDTTHSHRSTYTHLYTTHTYTHTHTHVHTHTPHTHTHTRTHTHTHTHAHTHTRTHTHTHTHRTCQSSDWSEHKLKCRGGRPVPVGLPFVVSLAASQLTYAKLSSMVEKIARLEAPDPYPNSNTSVLKLNEWTTMSRL